MPLRVRRLVHRVRSAVVRDRFAAGALPRRGRRIEREDIGDAAEEGLETLRGGSQFRGVVRGRVPAPPPGAAGRVPQPLLHFVGDPGGAPPPRQHLERDADHPRFLRERQADRVPDPGSRVSRELVVALRIELLRGGHQPEGAFLDEVAEAQARVRVLPFVVPGDGDRQQEMPPDEPLATGLETRAAPVVTVARRRLAGVPARGPHRCPHVPAALRLFGRSQFGSPAGLPEIPRFVVRRVSAAMGVLRLHGTALPPATLFFFVRLEPKLVVARCRHAGSPDSGPDTPPGVNPPSDQGDHMQSLCRYRAVNGRPSSPSGAPLRGATMRSRLCLQV